MSKLYHSWMVVLCACTTQEMHNIWSKNQDTLRVCIFCHNMEEANVRLKYVFS